jgi:hypothetical protein
LDRLRTSVIAAFALALVCAAPAMAQTAAQVQIVAGNGQVTCTGCFAGTGQIPFQFFFPMVIRVVDSSGQPIGNKQVDWTLVSSQGGVPNFVSQTFTDGGGIATNQLSQFPQAGSVGFPFLQTVLNATADGAVATFTETQGGAPVRNQRRCDPVDFRGRAVARSWNSVHRYDGRTFFNEGRSAYGRFRLACS